MKIEGRDDPQVRTIVIIEDVIVMNEGGYDELFSGSKSCQDPSCFQLAFQYLLIKESQSHVLTRNLIVSRHV